MKLEVLSVARDLRTDTPVVYAKLPISSYLSLVGEDFEEFSIQRRREKHKAYERMKQDLMNGALLPSITLAVKPERVDALLPHVAKMDFDALSRELSAAGQVNILDGLQRTYIIRDLEKDGHPFQEEQSLLLEFWLESNIRHLIYRIIVLNAGQKPMSMRHQIELLFLTLRTRVQENVPGLELYTERDQTRRRRSRKYALDRVAMAYQCFVTKTSEVQRENVVAQQLLEADLLDASEDQLVRQFDGFIYYLRFYAELDDDICRVYSTEDQERKLPTGANWFGSENVMNSFFAAIAQYSSPGREQRIRNSLDLLRESLRSAKEGDDPLGLQVLQALIDGFNPRKVNVGFATRKLITNGFKEFFRDCGETPLETCWTRSAE